MRALEYPKTNSRNGSKEELSVNFRYCEKHHKYVSESKRFTAINNREYGM